MNEMALKLVEKSVESVTKDPQLVMEIITPDILDFLWKEIQPYVEEECKSSPYGHTVMDVYTKAKWSGTNLYFFYIVPDLDTYYKGMDKNSPAGKFQRLLDKTTIKDFAGYILLDFNLHDKTSPSIWQACVVPKYENHNVYELVFKSLEKEFKELGVKSLIASGLRKDVHDKLVGMGFRELYTVYKLTMAS